MTDARARTDLTEALRALPGVDAVLRACGAPVGVALVREVVDARRAALLAGGAVDTSLASIVAEVEARRLERARPSYPRVVNGTGVLLHTGLGRAPLADEAREALETIADGYSLLEVDTAGGRRNRREDALLGVLGAVTGAEAGLVVNNNAAALLLALRALAAGAEVVVSRGELVEIGGGFRLPDVMALSGASLVEVGTTNRTYADDYARAVGERTGLLLKVHTSNFRVVGFRHAPERTELVELARRSGVPLLEDVGSGLLEPLEGVLDDEPAVRASIDAGVDLVCFSGDKLLGGPQAGLLVGRRDLVERCRRDPLFRAVRPDRLQLAALAATLRLHRDDPARVPVHAALAATPRERLEHARTLAAALARAHPALAFDAVSSRGYVGSGSVPGREVPSAAVVIDAPGVPGEQLVQRLRTATVPVFSRAWRGRCECDVLALRPGDDVRLTATLEEIASEWSSSDDSSA